MPWDTASVNFIGKLPESNGKDAIMVVVDSVTKHSHFVSMVTTLTAARSAQLSEDLPLVLPYASQPMHSTFCLPIHHHMTTLHYCLRLTALSLTLSV